MLPKSNGYSSIITIGITGGSGSGKTTFARMIQSHLGEPFCAILAQDSYYKDQSQRFDHDGGKVNFDHPDALEFSLMVQHLQELRDGRDILVPRYNFATHSRMSETIELSCRPVILVDGILILTQPDLRALLDFSYYIDTKEDLRFQRRLSRDVRERGRTAEGVHEQFYRQVKPMHDLFVEPTRIFASRIVSGEKSFGPVIEEIVYGLKHRPSSFNNCHKIL